MSERSKLNAERLKSKLSEPWSCDKSPSIADEIFAWIVALIICGAVLWCALMSFKVVFK